MKVNHIVLAIILALSNGSPFGVSVQAGPVMDDIAESERSFGKAYGETQGCRITFDNDNFNAALVKFRSKYIKLTSSKLRDFVLVHEVAHCFDGVPAPTGVDEIEWREYFADIFSGVELYRAGAITSEDYDQLIKLRSSSTQPFRVNALSEGKLLLEFDKNASSVDLALRVKEFRNERFTART